MSRFGRPAARKPKPSVPECEAVLVSDLKGCATGTMADLEKELAEAGLACSVEAAHHTSINWGSRHSNEDRVIAVTDSIGKIDVHTIGVLDGHDTDAASDFVSRHLPQVFSKHFKAGKPIEVAYTVAMAEVEDLLKNNKVATAGTCVCSCTVVGPYVWCANLGDCRAALVALQVPESAESPTRPTAVNWMSRDHKASAPEERRRIMSLGGQVTNGRIEGLEPTRTLGDFDVKLSTKPGVISIEPDVRCERLGDGTQTEQALLVCATDGVWDVISGQDVCDLIQTRKELAELQVRMARCLPGVASAKALQVLAEDLVQFAVGRGSRDDCTAVVALVSAGPQPR